MHSCNRNTFVSTSKLNSHEYLFIILAKIRKITLNENVDKLQVI